MIFYPDEASPFGIWWDILNLSWNGSGLMLNVAKISLIGFNMSEEGVEEWAEEFNVKWKHF